MKYISIVPIFNQSAPLIWSTFAYIQNVAMEAVYKYKTFHAETALNIAKLNTVWDRFGPCFAFAAYDNNKMIGCVHGCIDSQNATVHGLYVLPEYHKMGIGGRLLSEAERAASLYSETMELTALPKAQDFYRSHKYSAISPRDGLYSKEIVGRGRGNVLPVFFCSDSFAANCRALTEIYNGKFDASSVNKEHLPMFAYFNAAHELGGYILGARDKQSKDFHVFQLGIATSNVQDVLRELLESLATVNVR